VHTSVKMLSQMTWNLLLPPNITGTRIAEYAVYGLRYADRVLQQMLGCYWCLGAILKSHMGQSLRGTGCCWSLPMCSWHGVHPQPPFLKPLHVLQTFAVPRPPRALAFSVTLVLSAPIPARASGAAWCVAVAPIVCKCAPLLPAYWWTICCCCG